MSDASIQIRRITERVKRFYSIFGFNHYTRASKTRSIISGSRRLGFDEVECVVSETARGTSVGFYRINSFQSFFYAIPFLVPLFLLLLDKVPTISKPLREGNGVFSIDFITLLVGKASLDFNFTVIMLFVATIPVISELYNQQIRLSNLKSRFSFYSRDAVWETREISPQMIIIQSIKSTISHGYMLAILYFSIFSFTDSSLEDVNTIYRTNSAELNLAISSAFVLTSGMIIGLISADKALKLRSDNARFDSRSRLSGSLAERKLEPILFSFQAAIFSSVVFVAMMSQTFLVGVNIDLAIQLILTSLIGALIANLFKEERTVWISVSYALLVFISSLIFIFRTGNQSEYAFVVILQLFIIPIPFIIELSRNFVDNLKNEGITSKEWLYDIIPLTALISYLNVGRRKRRVQQAYEKRIQEEDLSELEEHRIKLTKQLFKEKDSNSYKLARHYFELLFTYTASFEENTLVLIPTCDQLLNWWAEQSHQKVESSYIETVNVMDRILWDPDYVPEDQSLSPFENNGKKMVFAIQ